jgi:hypothetical protein
MDREQKGDILKFSSRCKNMMGMCIPKVRNVVTKIVWSLKFSKGFYKVIEAVGMDKAYFCKAD